MLEIHKWQLEIINYLFEVTILFPQCCLTSREKNGNPTSPIVI